MTDLNRKEPPALHEITSIRLPDIQLTRLSNDIPTYIINTGSQDVLKLEFIFKAGRWNEPGKGVAAAVSALLKDGTSKRSALEIAQFIEFYGSTLTTHAFIDNSSIILFTLNKHLDNLLPLVKEILTEAVFPEKELGIYVRNSKQKLLVNLKKVEFLGQRKFTKTLYGANHPIGYTTSEQDLVNLNTDLLQQFHREYFCSDNCKIILSGKVEQQTVKAVEKLFGGDDWHSDIRLKTTVELNPATEKKYYEEKPDAVQSAIRIGKRFVNKKHPDYSKLKVLNTVLGGYFGSRLMSNLREDKGFCYGVFSSMVPFAEDAYLCISTEVGADVTERAVLEIYAEMKTLCNELIPEDELHTVKSFTMGTLLADVDGPFNASEVLRGLIAYDLTEDFFYNNIVQIRSVTAEELCRLACQYFAPETMTEVVVGKL